MSQVPLSNVSLSNLNYYLFNSNVGAISFSKLYNFTPDIHKYGNISISSLTSKYRNFIPTDINSLLLWYDANNNYLNNSINFNNLSSNIFSANINNNNNLPIFNKYGLNTYPCITYNNNNNYYTIKNDINIITNNLTIGLVFSGTSNYNSIITGGVFDIINNFLIINNNIVSIYNNNPLIYIFSLTNDSNHNLNINFRYNGTNINYIEKSSTQSSFVLNNNIKLFSNFSGNVSEFIIYNDTLSNSNIYLLESYFASKWWGVPSYVLPINHMYYNISPPNIVTHPQLLYLFDSSTSSFSSNLQLINFGSQGSLLNANIYNNYINYSSSYSTNINSLLIFYKFDNNNINYGSLGIPFNFNNIGTVSYNSLNKIKGSSSINLNNASISTTISYNSLSTDFSKFTEYTIMFWYYINTSLYNDTLFYINNDVSFVLKRNNNSDDLIFKNIIIPNAMIANNTWKNISFVMKKSNNNMILTIYFNSFLFGTFTINNTWLFTNNMFDYFIINNNADIFYDDFRLYNRCLSVYEIQEIFNLPISNQLTINNNFGFLYNSFNFNNFNNTICNIDYNNFFYIFFNSKNNYISILFNILIYNSFHFINIIHVSNTFKLSFKNNSANIFIDINYNTFRKTYTFNNDFLSHNYIFIIYLTNNNINFLKNTLLYIDKILITSSSLFNDLNGGDFFNSTTNFVYIGNYFNNSYSSLNTSPFLLENLQIYNTNITIADNIYNKYPSYSYYNVKNFPFNSIIFNCGNNKLNYLGPSYDNLIIPYSSSNNTWIYNKTFFNVNNGIQSFLIPSNGFYNIIAAGAAGGNSYTTNSIDYGGKGIIITNNVYLYKNDILYFIVGQKGGNGSYTVFNNNFLHGQGGGGGMSIVFNYTSNNIILIAGGGGGNGQYSIAKDATFYTNGTNDTNNIGNIAINGLGGYSGYHGLSDGYGVGGGGFYGDAEYFLNFSGISAYNIIFNNMNINIPTVLNVGGYGGFPSGATGGTSFNINNLIWGGGGGGGYSGGSGGSAANNGITLGGGGGGSYDINGLNNYANILYSKGLNGYNIDNGYINLSYITNDLFYIYAKANINIIYNGLVLLFEPYNTYCYNINTPYSITNLINGKTSLFNNIVNIQYNYITLISNSLTIPNINFSCISIFYKININDNLYLLINDITNINKNYCYFNNTTVSNINFINNVSTTWNFITLFGSFKNSNIILFNNILNINMGSILCYNRIITFNEHLTNYNSYVNKYY